MTPTDDEKHLHEAERLAKRQRELVLAESACCDEVLIELGLGSDVTIIVRKPGSNVIPFKRRQARD